MKDELIYFLQNTNDESVMAFIIGNMKKNGVDELFELLRFCDSETEERWKEVYSKMFMI